MLPRSWTSHRLCSARPEQCFTTSATYMRQTYLSINNLCFRWKRARNKLCFRLAGLFFRLSMQIYQQSLLGALRTPLGLRPLPGTPRCGARTSKCLRPALRAGVSRVLRRLGALALTLLDHLADKAVPGFVPCVWDYSFWFGFALRCVALLCGVYVRLHLVFFPAGGLFLPSLSVNLSINLLWQRGKLLLVNIHLVL
jgi:hypothetical protein